MQKNKLPNPDEILDIIKQREVEVDWNARRRFCLYAREARTNGYGFQAQLIETHEIPRVRQQLSEVKQEWTDFESKVGKSKIDSITRNAKGKRLRYNWKNRAANVGMADQYDFIYSYTSSSHAVSFHINQKNLEYREVEMFLEFTHVSLLDIIELARKRTSSRTGRRATF